MQAVAARAGSGRIEFEAEIVPPDEPVESALRLVVPPKVRCGAERFEASRDHCLRLDRLLVELRASAAAAVETVAPDRSKMTLLGNLQLIQPAQGFEASVEHRRL